MIGLDSPIVRIVLGFVRLWRVQSLGTGFPASCSRAHLTQRPRSLLFAAEESVCSVTLVSWVLPLVNALQGGRLFVFSVRARARACLCLESRVSVSLTGPGRGKLVNIENSRAGSISSGFPLSSSSASHFPYSRFAFNHMKVLYGSQIRKRERTNADAKWIVMKRIRGF